MTQDVLLLALAPDEVPQDDLQAIAKAAPDYELIVTGDRQRIEELAPRIGIAAGRVPPALLVEMPRLRWYQQWGAGADWLLRHPEVQQLSFVLTSASGVHSIPISEHILALLFAFARRLPVAFRAQQEGRWAAPDSDSLFELADKTLLLLGVGAIGARTAQVAAALDMHVIGVRRDPSRTEAGVGEMYAPDALADLLPRADFVVITIPLTPETQALIGADELARMKPSAILINIGRGGTIDQPALVDALTAKRIGGAGLDVFAEEPLPADSPLWGMDNVIITCHYSGRTPVYDARALAIFLDNLERFQRQAALRNVVDKDLGY